MRANCWVRPNTVAVEEVPDPSILNGRDAIVRITTTAICGSDLQLLDGYVPTMQKGDVLGHDFMGEVVAVGVDVPPDKLRVGDRVVVPFPIACGACGACARGLYSCCENSNPNAGMAEKLFGHPVCGIFGYSHLTGGFAGGQAEYARVPFADVGPLKIESDLSDEQVLFLSDILPTGYMGADMCDITPGDIVAARMETDRPHALRQAITCCRSGGVVSVIGVYGGFVDTYPAGSWMNRSLVMRTGQCHVQRYQRRLLERIERKEIDPTRVITHTLPLDEAPSGYDIFKHKKDGCEKVVLKP